jgi:hypothetical protein
MNAPVLLPDEIYPGEFTTHPSLEEPDRGILLTVAIGVWTLTGPSIILAADTRVTYGTSPVQPHDQASKQYPLPPFNCAAVIAGSVTESHEFIARLVQQFERLAKQKRTPDRQDVMKAMDEARYRVWRPKLDWTMKARFGMSLAQWHKKFLPPQDVDIFNSQSQFFGNIAFLNTPLKLSSIVGGFIDKYQMFFCAHGMEHILSESNPGVYAIGTGRVHAMRRLTKRGQNIGHSLARTVFHVHEAMLAARQERTVGPPTNYAVVVKDQPMRWIHSECELLKVWRRRYRNRDTEELDTSEAHALIKAELRDMRMPPYDKPL